jgi:predicted Zn-ribbon and HTH transcriptional regulator
MENFSKILGGVASTLATGLALFRVAQIAEGIWSECHNSFNNPNRPGDPMTPDLTNAPAQCDELAPIPDHVEIDPVYIDPISQSMMVDPYIIKNCGHSFEKTMIVSWLDRKQTCPLCHRQAIKSDLIPNFALKDVLKAKREEIIRKCK